MCKQKIILILVLSCLFFLFPQKANAQTASNIADKTIEYTAKGAYYIAKYTLKASWFVIKKTAKGVKEVSKGIYSASKDAFISDSAGKPLEKRPDYVEYRNSLPPPPPVLD